MIALAALALASGARAGDGREAFEDRCQMCHVPEGGGQGPSLTTVSGRKAGSVPGFAYSPALKDSGLVWTRQTLDKFIADPRAVVPGTAMPIRVTDANVRADIVAYLTK
jgi:cytochrome c2